MADVSDLFMAHDNEAERWRESRPVCKACGEHIQDEYLYETLRGLLCEECASAYADDLAAEYKLDLMGEWRRDAERYGEFHEC